MKKYQILKIAESAKIFFFPDFPDFRGNPIFKSDFQFSEMPVSCRPRRPRDKMKNFRAFALWEFHKSFVQGRCWLRFKKYNKRACSSLVRFNFQAKTSTASMR